MVVGEHGRSSSSRRQPGGQGILSNGGCSRGGGSREEPVMESGESAPVRPSVAIRKQDQGRT